MIGQKLTIILQSLDEEEFKRLKKALSSPYFATNPKLLTIYAFLAKHYPVFDEAKLDREKFFKKLYPGKPYNEGMFRVIIREFSTVVEDYIMLERLRSDKWHRKKNLVREYGERKLYPYFKKGILELVAALDQSDRRDMDHFSERINFFQTLCFHPMTDNYTVGESAIQELMDSLDAYFFLAKYRFAQVLKNNDTIFNRKSEVKFWDIVTADQYNLSAQYPLIDIYRNLNMLHETGEENFYFASKTLFDQHFNTMGRIDQQIIYFLHLNYCTRQINAGKLKFSPESLSLYKLGLENGLLIENGIMSDITFTNICIAACREKEVKWAEGFVKQYESFVNPDLREEAVNMSKMTLLFNTGRYDEMLQVSQSLYFSKKYQLQARTITVLAIFELAIKDFSYYQMLFSTIDANRKYLLRDEVYSEARKLANKNFLRVVENFAKMLVDKKGKDKIKSWLEREINSDKLLISKVWFIEKAGQL